MLMFIAAGIGRPADYGAYRTDLCRQGNGNAAYIDGSNSAELEKQANAMVRDAAAKLVKEVGGQGSVTYKVMLNRPSMVSLLLEADNGGRKAYTGTES